MNKLTKTLLFIIAVFGLHHTLTARPVDLQTAQSVAVKFMGASDAQLVSTYRTDKSLAAFYVFNTEDGFVIVSADDCETPIIGYSHEGRFDPNNVPVQMEDYLQNFVARILYGIENHIVADETTARQWELVKTTGRLNESKSSKSVEPLLTEMWEQGCFYNDLCPTFSKVPCGHAEVGCVAVAMGQIMHYWRYPETGWGSHSYNNAGLTLSADFGNTVYNWDHMPDSLTDDSSDVEVEAVATLLFHCGVAVNMRYTTNGSGADSGDVPDALIRYFNYSRRLHFEKRSDFSDDEWMSMLKVCLDLQRPVFYGGKGSQGSHAFVCDGYDGNNLLHFNWGWGRANGYFALGHLNPIGYSFNENNFAILDINPEYEPWIVHATPYPTTAGTIEGIGEYHIGEQCTLTAVPAENSRFCCWKKSGRIISYDMLYSFSVNDDIDDIEANFSYQPIKQIMACHAPDTNDINSPFVSLSWTQTNDHDWPLLKQFEISWAIDLATDGECIYTCTNNYIYPDSVFEFGKYTMDGALVEQFNLGGLNLNPTITYDGTYFYYSNLVYPKGIICVDLANKSYIDTLNMDLASYGSIAYDAENDGFWIFNNNPNTISLVNRQGQLIKHGPAQPPISTIGAGFTIANDGTPHLLLLGTSNAIYDFDLTNNSINNHPLMLLGSNNAMGLYIGNYDGKDAMFTIIGETICIYEIKSELAQIIGYRIYRADSEGNIVMLADEVTNTSFIDYTWNEAQAGEYRFGISEVYANGVESEIIWSDTIMKTDFGIDENGNQESPEPSVQKVIEDGHIIIIKDGKRYNVSGQHLN